jgi:L-alanine-DL-glutamate epimerase-like enolase superfamily enzyme
MHRRQFLGSAAAAALLGRAARAESIPADMNSFGIELTLAEAAMARPQGILIAPHNWGSLLGFYQQLHVAPAVPNFYFGASEHLRRGPWVDFYSAGFRLNAAGTCGPRSPERWSPSMGAAGR